MDNDEKVSQTSRASQTSSLRSYNPYKHRHATRPTSYCETLFHIVKGLLGTGIFAMPEAFANSGWLNGIISTILISIFVVYCLNMLIKGKMILCKRNKIPDLSFSESMRMALKDGPDCLKFLSNVSRHIINAIIVVYQIGGCCVLVLFIGKNLKQFYDVQFSSQYDLRVWILMVSTPLLILSQVRTLKSLAPISLIGNAFSVVGVLLVMHYLVTDLPPLKERNMIAPIYRYPSYLGFIFFATDAFGVAIISESNMKRPEAFLGFCGTFSIGMLFFSILMVIVGFFGYWKYGEHSQGSVTLNIPDEEK